MKRRFYASLSLFLVAVVLSFSSFIPSSDAAKVIIPKVEDKDMVLVSNPSFDADSVRNARFLNMLNHNYVYNEAFQYPEDIVNNSIIALLNLRDPVNDSYIAENFVKDYVFNIYGIEIDDFSEINSQFPKLEGYVYIVPRGFSDYKHSISSVSINEDGSYTVISDVIISSHDGVNDKTRAVSLFVKNEASDFGYSIIYSNIDSAYSDL